MPPGRHEAVRRPDAAADDSFLRPDLIVSDVVYNPRKTHLLEVAEKKAAAR
jgi:shikimate 5-dehydrogenase